MNKLELQLKEFKPKVTQSTINQYMLNLRNLYNALYPEKREPLDLAFLKNRDKILEILDSRPNNTKKNILNSIIVFTQILLKTVNVQSIKDTLEVYIKLRDELNKEYFENGAKNIKTEKQSKNWMEYEEIDNIAKALKSKDFQAYVALSTHLYLPLRNDLPSLEVMTPSKYKKLDADEKRKTNALLRSPNKYVIKMNNYKTAGKYDEKTIEIPPELNSMYKKLIKLNEGKKYLFINPKTDTKYNNNQWTLFFNKMFKHTGKKISTTLLRNIVLSHKYGDTLKQQKEDAKNMMHSIDTQKLYIKTD